MFGAGRLAEGLLETGFCGCGGDLIGLFSQSSLGFSSPLGTFTRFASFLCFGLESFLFAEDLANAFHDGLVRILKFFLGFPKFLGRLLEGFDGLLLLRDGLGLVALFECLLCGSQGLPCFGYGLLGLCCFRGEIGNLCCRLCQSLAAFNECCFLDCQVGKLFCRRVFGFVQDFLLLLDQGLSFFFCLAELAGLLELAVELDGGLFGQITGTGQGCLGLLLVWFSDFGKIVCQESAGTLHCAHRFFEGFLEAGILGLLLQVLDMLCEGLLRLGDVLDVSTLGGLFFCFDGELFLESFSFFERRGHFSCVIDSLHLVPFQFEIIELFFSFFTGLAERFNGL